MLPEIATALEYPHGATAHACRAAVQGDGPMARAMAELATYLEATPLCAVEERYTVLFDLNPVSSLYVGWHLFEDTYARGALLAGLAGELTRAAVPFAHDLPDFLPTLLRLLTALRDDEDRVLLVHGIVLPALAKMTRALGTNDAPWAGVLQALGPWLQQSVPRGNIEVPRARAGLEVLPC
jgi:nitrate reductase delta subunit